MSLPRNFIDEVRARTSLAQLAGRRVVWYAKGDVFGFVRETENVEFIESVRILALEAGIPMPEDGFVAQMS